MTSNRTDVFAGTWRLLPELCVYDEGSPPEHATYRIDQDGDDVRVVMAWQPADDGQPRSATFAGRADGRVRALPEAPGVTGVSITRVDERTLDTATWYGDQVASSARRTASADGELLVVVQTTTRRDGPAVRALQVYRRQAQGRVAS